MEREDHPQPQSKRAETIVSQINQQQESLQDCSCGSKEKVMFQCDEQTCPNFQKQKLYCGRCMIPQKHPHIPILIALKSQNVTEEWINLGEQISTLFNKVKEWMDQHRLLVELLDSFLTNENQTLRFKFNRLLKLKEDRDTLYQQKVAESSAKGDILQLKGLEPQFNEFKRRLSEFDPIKNIGPAVLWRLYSDVLHLVNHEQAIEKLKQSQNNFEIFLKLKLYRAQLSLKEVNQQTQSTQISPQQYLENPELLINDQITSMHQQLHHATQSQVLSATESVKIDGIRSELDAIGMSRVVQKQNAKIYDLEDNISQFKKLIESRFEQMKGELNDQHKFFQLDFRIIQRSLILAEQAQQIKIQQFFEQAGTPLKYSRLLYRGSVDTFAASAFHKLCDNKSNTLTIVKTTEGKIIGGYTTQTWDGKGYKQDNNAWLFNIEAPSIFKVKQGLNAIYAESSFGPDFGSNDLGIRDNCNKNNSSCVKGTYYQCIGGVSNLLLTQDKEKVQFTVLEIEVYQVFF